MRTQVMSHEAAYFVVYTAYTALYFVVYTAYTALPHAHPGPRPSEEDTGQNF